MEIALIFPRYKYPSGDTPLGLLYIATYLKEKTTHNVDVFDTTFHKDKSKLNKALHNKKYDIVGISLMTTMLRDADWISRVIKGYSPETKVIWGGPHPTVLPELSLGCRDVDAIVIGEGEETWLDLVKKKGVFRGVNGIWYKEGKDIIANEARPFIDDLDKLPFPDHELVDLDSYFKHWFQLDSVARNLKGINLISSRGCPYQCSFCQPTLNRLFGTRIRKRSPENIVEELEFWKEKRHIDAFMFQDDTLICDKPWVSSICDAILEKKLNLKWGCNVRANLVDYKIFSKMKKAGLRKVFMGIESGSQRVLDDVYQKGITIRQVKDAVTILKSLNLKVQGYFMLGAPTETIEEAKKTIRFARQLDIDEATFSITTPLPHTHLYEKTKHLISEDVADFDYYKTPVYKGEAVIDKVKLQKLKRKALLSFYLAPKRVISTLGAFATPSAIKKSVAKLKRF